MMLQQTQVPTVIPYYQKFLKTFPTLSHLAKANLSKVLKIWEGLGYYSRARNLHRASQMVLNHFQGKIPDNLKDLLSLPGIGRYTAGAILSIAFNREVPILDGNVKRVLSRLFAISGNSRKTENLLWEVSAFLIPKGRSNSFNQALMDLGSMTCTPKDPQCPTCPLRKSCKGKASGRPENYPTRRLKKPIPHVEALSIVFIKDGKVFLNQRPAKGLFGGLWEFPNWKVEDKKRLRLGLRKHIGTFKQTYSHFKLTLHVFHCDAIKGKEKGKWIPIRNLHQLPMSRIYRRIADALSEKNLADPASNPDPNHFL